MTSRWCIEGGFGNGDPEGKGMEAEDRIQDPESRSQKPEDGRQKTEDRIQKAEARRQQTGCGMLRRASRRPGTELVGE
jgi:hypothetical protein